MSYSSERVDTLSVINTPFMQSGDGEPALPAQWDDIMAAPIQHLLQKEPAFSGPLQLRVHPALLPLVEQHLAATLDHFGWHLQADPQLHPGAVSCARRTDH